MSGASMPHRLIADSVFLRFLNVRVTKVAARRMSAAEQVRWSRAREPIQNSMAFKTNCMRFGVRYRWAYSWRRGMGLREGGFGHRCRRWNRRSARAPTRWLHWHCAEQILAWWLWFPEECPNHDSTRLGLKGEHFPGDFLWICVVEMGEKCIIGQ